MAKSTAPPLLPQPRRFEPRRGVFVFREDVPIVVDPEPSASTFSSARVLQTAIRAVSGVLLPIEARAQPGGVRPRIRLAHGRQPDGVDADRYRLDIGDEQITALGGGASGLRYAVETLVQLLGRERRRERIAGCEIEDAPDFALRGLMLDVSRGKVPRPETLHAIVDLCVSLKLNALMLYTEHTFRFRSHSKIGADASPLTAEVMLELDRYAAERFVQLIPCLQSLGHMEHVLKLPEYRELAETDLGWTIAPVHPGTPALLEDLYADYLPNFRSPLFNANCDEPWDLGRGQSKARSEELGPGGLFLEHVGRLQEIARRHGKRTMIWGDVVHAHPERIDEIDRDLVLLDWWYEADFDYDRVEAFKRRGLEFVVCPGTSGWNSLFPRMKNSLTNIARWADAGRRFGALGMINTDWGDFGHYNLQGNSFMAFAWGAQQSWSGGVEAAAFDRAFSRRLFGDASGEAARIYRELGAVHDPGFEVFNGSAIQYLFFDDLDESYFLVRAKRAALQRCERKLERVCERIAKARDAFGNDLQTWEELRYAADASRFALRKAGAARRYNDWRAKPASLAGPERKRLARALAGLAEEQAELGRRLRRLWLARSAISNFEMTKRRLDRSRRSLRKAARALERNQPPAPPEPAELTAQGVVAAVRRSLG